jgi:hypothetical protein
MVLTILLKLNIYHLLERNVETIRNIEYFLEVYEYKNFGRDRYYVKDIGFDGLVVHNSEQISPSLNLVLSPENP